MSTRGDAANLEILPPVRLYDGPAPGSEGWTHVRRRFYSEHFSAEAVVNVVDPTLTTVVPEAPCGTSIVVAPGGGFHGLSIESEGFAVARWLAERGVTAHVLEYRVAPGGDDPIDEVITDALEGRWTEVQHRMQTAAVLACADAQMAIRAVRAQVAESTHGSPRVGFLGFSAGGNVGIRLALASASDARPDFQGWIYPAISDLDVSTPPAGSGPLFLAVAADDELGLADDAIRLHQAWSAAGMSSELHVYAKGGHGFGMRQGGTPATGWIERFHDWLTATGLLGS